MILQAFLGAAFLFNGIPHLVKGSAGEKHMTPFHRQSSAIVNVIWGFVNILIGIFILGTSTFSGGDIWAFFAGGLFMSLADAWLFSKPDAKFPWQKD